MKLIKASVLILFMFGALGIFGEESSTLTPDTMWTYKQIDGKELQTSVFLSDNYGSAEKLPIIVFFHGGSWNTGEASWQYSDCDYWSKRGMIDVSVDYRLKDRDGIDVPLECVKDAKSTIRFLRKNALEFKIDTEKVVIAGDFAGGQLAAAMTTIGSKEINNDCYDVSISCKPNTVILTNPYFKCKPQLSPPRYVVRGLPPFITFLGDKDPSISVASMREFHDDLQQAGNASILYIGKVGKHGFCNRDNKSNRFFYWSLEMEDQFLVKHGILCGMSKVKVPDGVAHLQQFEYDVYE